MRILSIESFSVKPHFETAIELSLKNKFEKNEVYFVFFNFFYDIQRIPWHLKLGFFGNIKWLKKDNVRVKQILKKILLYGIDVRFIKPRNFLFFIKAVRFSLSHPYEIERVKDYCFQGVNLGIGAASTLISRCDLESPDIKWWSLTIKKLLFESAISYQLTIDLINNISPNIVYTYNGRFAVENAIAQACIKKNIKILIHERGGSFDKYDVFDFPLHSFSNFEKKINKYWESSEMNSKIEISKEFFEKKRKGIETYWMSYNKFYSDDFKLPYTNKIKVVFFSSSDDELASVFNSETQPIFKKQRECIKYLINFFSDKDDYLFILRNHPNISTKHKKDKFFWDNLTGNNLLVFESTSKINSYNLIEYADIVITYISTVGIEATYWNKPSVLMGLSYYRFLDCTYNPTSIEEFEKLFTNHLLPKNKELCYPFGFFYNSFGNFYQYYHPKSFFDGDLII